MAWLVLKFSSDAEYRLTYFFASREEGPVTPSHLDNKLDIFCRWMFYFKT